MAALLDIPFVHSFMLGILPGLALRVFVLLLPVLLYPLNRLGGAISKADVDFEVATQYFLFQVLTVFGASFISGWRGGRGWGVGWLVGCFASGCVVLLVCLSHARDPPLPKPTEHAPKQITGTIFSQIQRMIKNPQHTLVLLGNGVPQTASFFILCEWLTISRRRRCCRCCFPSPLICQCLSAPSRASTTSDSIPPTPPPPRCAICWPHWPGAGLTKDFGSCDLRVPQHHRQHRPSAGTRVVRADERVWFAHSRPDHRLPAGFGFQLHPVSGASVWLGTCLPGPNPNAFACGRNALIGRRKVKHRSHQCANPPSTGPYCWWPPCSSSPCPCWLRSTTSYMCLGASARAAGACGGRCAVGD